jgi:hypothetical protein
MNLNRTRLVLVVSSVVLFPNLADAFYAPHMGRWTSRDSYGEGARMGMELPPAPGLRPEFISKDRFVSTPGYQDGMNLYQYARSTPTSSLDPSGQLVHPPAPLICNPVGAAATACVVGPAISYKISECTLAPLTGWVVDWWTRVDDPVEVKCKLIGSAERQRQQEVRCTYSCGSHGQKEIFLPWPYGTPMPSCDLEKNFWF